MIFLRNYCTYSQKASMVYVMYIKWIFQCCTFWFLCFYNFFYIVHFLMNNIKKCKSSNIKNFFAPHYYRLLLLGTLTRSPKGVHNNGS